MSELNKIAAQSVCLHIKAQGDYNAWLRDEIGGEGDVIIGVPPLLIRCDVTPPKGGSASVGASMTSVALTAIPLDGREARRNVYTTVVEQAVEQANDAREAVVYATHAWCEGVLPPLRSALLSPLARKGVTGETDNIIKPTQPDDLVQVFPLAVDKASTGGTLWNLHVGVSQVGGARREEWSEAAVADYQIVPLLKDALTNALAATSAEPPQMHWIKVFVVLNKNGALAVDCRWDNEEWTSGATTVQNHPWPQPGELVIYRQFLVLAPADAQSAGSHPLVEE